MTDQDTSHTAACHLDEQRLTAALRAAARDASSVSLLRGALLHFVADPEDAMLSEAASRDGNDEGNRDSRASDMAAILAHAVEHYPDALLVMYAGHVVAVGDHHSLARHEAVGELMRLCPPRNVEGLMMPGFIDTHVHFPQLDIIASYGHCLIDWLNTYTFPEEMRFADPGYARAQADTYLDLLIANGTLHTPNRPTLPGRFDGQIMHSAEYRSAEVFKGKRVLVTGGGKYSLDAKFGAGQKRVDG